LTKGFVQPVSTKNTTNKIARIIFASWHLRILECTQHNYSRFKDGGLQEGVVSAYVVLKETPSITVSAQRWG